MQLIILETESVHHQNTFKFIGKCCGDVQLCPLQMTSHPVILANVRMKSAYHHTISNVKERNYFTIHCKRCNQHEFHVFDFVNLKN